MSHVVVLAFGLHDSNLLLQNEVPYANHEIFCSRYELQRLWVWEERESLNDTSVAQEIVSLKAVGDVEDFNLAIGCAARQELRARIKAHLQSELIGRLEHLYAFHIVECSWFDGIIFCFVELGELWHLVYLDEEILVGCCEHLLVGAQRKR